MEATNLNFDSNSHVCFRLLVHCYDAIQTAARANQVTSRCDVRDMGAMRHSAQVAERDYDDRLRAHRLTENCSADLWEAWPRL